MRKAPVLDARLEHSEWVNLIAEKYGLAAIDLGEWNFAPEILEMLPRDFVRSKYVFPVNLAEEALIVAMADPGDHDAREEAVFLSGRSVIVVATTHESIDAALSQHYK